MKGDKVKGEKLKVKGEGDKGDNVKRERSKNGQAAPSGGNITRQNPDQKTPYPIH